MFSRAKAAEPAASTNRAPASYQQQARHELMPPESSDTPLSPLVETAMHEIVAAGWDFMMHDDFNPLQLALELLDTTTTQSRSLEEFTVLMQHLEAAMDRIVDDHYEAFNHSVATFGRVMDSMDDSQGRLRSIRDELSACKRLLVCKRPDLRHLWAKSVQLKEILRMLSSIDELKQAPDRVATLLQSKRYYFAVSLLMKSAKTLAGSDYSDIGALSDIKLSLSISRNTIHETIIEELHRYLYLTDIPIGILHGLQQENTRITEADYPRWQHDDPALDVTSSPLASVQSMLAALEAVGRLTDAFVIVRQRAPLEIHKIVDASISETRTRWSLGHLHYSSYSKKQLENRTFWTKYSMCRDGVSNRILEELMTTLYSKLTAVIKVHIFAIDMYSRISVTDTSKVPYKISDLWIDMQEQVTSLLQAYISEDDRTFSRSGVSSNATKAMVVDRRRFFQFNDSELQHSTSTYEAEILKSDVPANKRNTDHYPIKLLSNAAGVVDRLAVKADAAGHELLVLPTIFNIAPCFEKTILFANSVNNVIFGEKVGELSPGSPICMYLNERLLNGFFPQVEDIVAHRYHEAVNGSDSFRVESFALYHKPLFRCVVQLVDLTKDLMLAVHKIPVHQDQCVKILETMLAKFSDKCMGKFNAAIASDSKEQAKAGNVLSYQWTQINELRQFADKNTYLQDVEAFDPGYNEELAKQEANFLIEMAQKRSFHRSELLFDGRKLEFLAHMHTSLGWFIAQLSNLVKEARSKTAHILIRPPSEVIMTGQFVRQNPSLGHFGHGYANDVYSEDYVKEAVCLEASDSRIWESKERISHLGKNAMYVLRMEIRIHCLYYLDFSLREGDYLVLQPIDEPDPYVVALNHDLIKTDECISHSLADNEKMFLFDGISILLSDFAIFSAQYIKRLNNRGVEKILKSIMALQQNLSNITFNYETRMDAAKRYFELFSRPLETVFADLEEHGPIYPRRAYYNILSFKYDLGVKYADHPERKLLEAATRRLNGYFK